jgi:hypothetical protein
MLQTRPYADHREIGHSLVRIVDEFGTHYLRALSRRITPAANADYMFSTVYRAKGLERKQAKVADDLRFRMVDGRLTLR